jgi:hypothetical protein
MIPLCPTEAQVIAWISCPEAQRGTHGYITQSYAAFRGYCELIGLLEIEALSDAVHAHRFSWRDLFDDPACALACFEDMLADERRYAEDEDWS